MKHDWVRRALTRHLIHKGRVHIVEPDEKLVLGVKFAIAMTLCLSALEIAHIAFLGSWNSEIFAGITGLIGTVSGILISQKS
ncbi:hypothetical protein MUO83_02165 [Candidatus Bathyarchaeota archaeon]|nr:hypothetical protein [Candidatus Bathyarchaeota archaeon]